MANVNNVFLLHYLKDQDHTKFQIFFFFVNGQ